MTVFTTAHRYPSPEPRQSMHATPSCLFKIHFNVIYLHLDLPSYLFPWRFPITTSLVHLIFFDVTGEDRKSCSSLLCRFVQRPASAVQIEMPSSTPYSASRQYRKLLERSGNFYVYRETHLNNQLNGKSTLVHNKIFESVIQPKHAR